MQDIEQYIAVRNHELSQDEIITVIKIIMNDQNINHLDYMDGTWQYWYTDGGTNWFRKRNW